MPVVISILFLILSVRLAVWFWKSSTRLFDWIQHKGLKFLVLAIYGTFGRFTDWFEESAQSWFKD
jgi:hypothetical protein